MGRKTNILLMVYGAGGHKAQAHRVVNALNVTQTRIVTISDDSSRPEWSDYHVVAPGLREKSRSSGSLIAAWQIFWQSIHIIRKHHVTSMISTGPGIAIIPALILRICGGKVIHLETWSRFYTRSLAGRVMYLIANRFYYQNKTLSKFYPKGMYGGRL
ncbi:hypothetical protein HMF8227_00751 [Saliniradius amylolyticus]|uniref:Uncharacterized protein n=1 Tax=Saliniradius amylolyticus TaxID=2183582 RepID=A0A2S2E2K3_9ALTE|nr:PssD/Cps14F family polysaccharide biosynthesis glycosyltransferase [Saliniradius amylolyticus]AWL11247.1 hypothetical protein HMF8227_00751 [Saliniradius amylolyticus]